MMTCSHQELRDVARRVPCRLATATMTLAALAALALPGHAQTPRPLGVRAAGGTAADTLGVQAYVDALAALPADTRAELTALVDSARPAGVPAAPLRRKVIEGVAKRAEPARIVAVVRSVGAGLRTARSVLGPVGDADLEAAGAAVQAGVVPEQLRQLRAALPRGRSLTQALVVLTDLTRRGVPLAESVRTLARLARAGVADADLAQWRAEVAADLAAGVGSQAAASARADAFLRDQHRPARSVPVVSPAPGPLDP